MKSITRSFIKVSLSILAVYLTTSIHHVYGAWLYSTPWRNHIAYQGLTWLLISYGILLLTIRWNRQWIKWLFVLFSGFFFIGAIGLYEGFYNHVVKNMLYFIGFGESLLLKMYPPPKYELPNDLTFELSGVFTFIVCVWCYRTMVDFIKASEVNSSLEG